MKKKEYFKSLVLRKKGYSLSEISEKLDVSKSTVSGWVKDIKLSNKSLFRLEQKVTKGQLQSAENKREKTKQKLSNFNFIALQQLNDCTFTDYFLKLSCSLIYWCEGGKGDNTSVRFTNSDPLIIATFINLFRKSFSLKEEKFRACVHLHHYHLADKQIDFWSNVTSIPKAQFIKPYLKKNTGKRTKKDYQGCVQVRYYDADITKELIATGKVFFEKYIGA